jgi:hypothetical protein
MRFTELGLLTGLLVFLSGAVVAQDEPVTQVGIDGDDEVDLTPTQEYDRMWRQIDGLVIYNALLERQIANQEREVEQIRASMDEVPEIARQVPALLQRMVDSLEQFIALDLPFLPEERAERVENLKLLIERGDVNDADKFRRILEAWQIENDYGRNYSAYEGQIEINGTTREAHFLQLGRIALIYQTPDLEFAGAWNQSTRSWQPLGTTHRNNVRQAIRMARQQVAPDLVLLPVPAPES